MMKNRYTKEKFSPKYNYYIIIITSRGREIEFDILIITYELPESQSYTINCLKKCVFSAL